MPTVLTPIPSTADSVNTDSVADAYYAPQYLQSGFSDSAAHDGPTQWRHGPRVCLVALA